MKQPQHIEALDHANTVRLARAALKREIKEGKVKLSDLLREGIPDHCASMSAESLLKTPRRMFTKEVARLLGVAVLSPYQRADQITTRQRLLLADCLEEWESTQKAYTEKAAA